MRCPNCLYDNHEQAEVCERCGEPLHGENRMFNTCKNCGYINEVDAEYCASCDEPMAPSSFRKSARKALQKKQKRTKNSIRHPSGEGCSSGFFLLILILIALALLGLIQQSSVVKPAAVAETETLLTLQGTSDLRLSAEGNPTGFSALAMDPAGITRMSLYVDGKLVGAKNFDSATQAAYYPGLNGLKTGEHALFFRSINGNGQATYSQTIIVNLENMDGGSFELASDPLGLPVPADIRINSLNDGKQVSVSWDPTAAEVGGVRVYVRPPRSSGLVHLADVEGDPGQYVFSTDRSGTWEVYLSYLSKGGFESELGFASLSIDVEGIDLGSAPLTLPRPSKVHLVVRESDCQKVASQLGGARDVYYEACLANLTDTQHEFLVWNWPVKWQDGALYTYGDVLGFELKLILTNSDGTSLGEKITAIPFSEIHGAFRTSPEVDCGIQRSWYVRAVGAEAYSDWAYAGSVAAGNCEASARETDGCAGQADGVVLSNLPEGFMPDLFFQEACQGLDLCYAEGTIGQPKVGCDNLYRTNLLAICSQNENDVDLAICQEVADDFYKAANLFGSAYYPMAPSFKNCLNADKVAGCFEGNVSAGTRQGVEKVRSATLWLGKTIWTGANRFGAGVLWLVDWGVSAVGEILPE